MISEKYQNLIENAVDSIAILHRHEIKVANAQLLKMFGCRHKEEMVNHPFTEFVAPEHRELINQMCLEGKDGEAFPYHWEFKALRCDGKKFNAELFTNLIEFQGQIARQAIVKDISNEIIAGKERRKSSENLTNK